MNNRVLMGCLVRSAQVCVQYKLSRVIKIISNNMAQSHFLQKYHEFKMSVKCDLVHVKGNFEKSIFIFPGAMQLFKAVLVLLTLA